MPRVCRKPTFEMSPVQDLQRDWERPTESLFYDSYSDYFCLSVSVSVFSLSVWLIRQSAISVSFASSSRDSKSHHGPSDAGASIQKLRHRPRSQCEVPCLNDTYLSFTNISFQDLTTHSIVRSLFSLRPSRLLVQRLRCAGPSSHSRRRCSPFSRSVWSRAASTWQRSRSGL